MRSCSLSGAGVGHVSAAYSPRSESGPLDHRRGSDRSGDFAFNRWASWPVRKERHCLPVQPPVSHYSADTAPTRKVEGHDLVLRDTVENAVGPKPQTAGSAELGRTAGREHPDELTVYPIF